MRRTTSRAVRIAGLALLGLALGHSFEDFGYGIPEQRFGIETTPAAILLAVAFTVQVVALAARPTLVTYVANSVAGAVWFLAAAIDHLGEVLTASPYRAGFVSKALEVGVMAAGLVLALAALSAIAVHRRAAEEI